ncbi:ethanolamine ammonia-lyase subunit EutB [Cryptosporangium aurantiacum]|uniref:Ethanolamine ammonia-lyase large subunit n=1 Tax=Cryptosporangium aurantiacum TaxID=134849 RepID=A0A1M7RPB1_9ACTN|nr:ethanolamine ammonia-lyase subunit EutB [Cryptosporangium aurantiacum]SHN47942.1 Ethanolamine ammonia-lyase heavy chain [Cryptosporangium aurantiacum]
MNRTATVRGERFGFGSLAEILAKANEPKSGDVLAGVAARSEAERMAAKFALADLRLAEIVDEPLVDDEVTAAILSGLDRDRFDSALGSLTVGEFREFVLAPGFAAHWPGLRDLVIPEIAAATAKLMSNLDLIRATAPLRVETTCRTTVGQPGVLAARLQPNHPTDDLAGIAYSILDGLAYGCGDALIGVNPAIESVDTVAAILGMLEAVVDELAVPTQACVLAHVTTQLAALERGATVDLLFQSVAGTETANRAFGIDLALLGEAAEAVRSQHASNPARYAGRQAMYFETGQGSALSSDAHHGIDQLTCEARAQAVARLFDPFLVNSVVGFIGPEYLADSDQITRAGLEDHFVGKLMGLPMGCDVCFTNHVEADHNSNDNLLVLLGAAGANFVMGVPAGDDIMLGYQSTSYHDVATARTILGRSAAPEFDAWHRRMSGARGRDLPADLPADLGGRLTILAGA